MGVQEILAVHPAGWQSEPEQQVIKLSAFDQVMPKIYVLMVLVYKLPEQSSEKQIIEDTTAGLETTLSQFPVLAGTLQSEEDNTLWVLRKKGDTVNFIVNHIEDDFYSYEELDRRDFPSGLLEGSKLIPKAATDVQLFRGDNGDKDTFISAFQLNFIRGGLILGLSIHHNISDGPGCDGFLTTWANNTRAIADNKPVPPFEPMNLDRSQLSSAVIPDAKRMEELQRKIPEFKHNKKAPAPPPADFVMPEMNAVMWHFPKTKLVELKTLCKPAPGSGTAYVSTYDCIMGMLWKTMTRAKIPMLKADLLTSSILMHAVNNRQMTDPPLPERFLGNAVSLATTERRTLESLAGISPAAAAALVRDSITRITSQKIHDVTEWVNGTPNKSWIGMNVNAFLGPDLAGTSWTRMTSYTAHDFGFGLPMAVRWPKPDWEGYALVYPQRVKDDPEEGFECCVLLEKGCQERLMKDEELLQFAAPRGL